jgi:hypothetical protein
MSDNEELRVKRSILYNIVTCTRSILLSTNVLKKTELLACCACHLASFEPFEQSAEWQLQRWVDECERHQAPVEMQSKLQMLETGIL